MSWVLPVLNEQDQLRESVNRISDALAHLGLGPGSWEVIVADNGSTDRTPQIAIELARPGGHIKYLRLDQRGRGRALREAWSNSPAEVFAYCDVDLSTDLAHVPELLQPLLGDQFDLAIGSRLKPGALTKRGLVREILSRTYSRLTRTLFRSAIRDFQCGFKAIRKEAAILLLPLVENNHWFFDTELLVLAQYSGFRVSEIPVHWTDDPDSRVKIIQTVLEDIRGLLRLRRQIRLKSNTVRLRYQGRTN